MNPYLLAYCKDDEDTGASDQWFTVRSGRTIPLSQHTRTLTDWYGNPIGTYVPLSRWRVNSWNGTHMYAISATVRGKRYHGRTFGPGMSVKLYPYKDQ